MNGKRPQTREEARDRIAAHPEWILTPDGCGRGYICPICGSGAGEHGTGLYIQRDGRHFTCFAGNCFRNKDIFEIIGIKYGLSSFYDQLNKAAELANETLRTTPTPPRATPTPRRTQNKSQERTDYRNAYRIWNSCIDQTDYWNRRGLTQETANRFMLGYNTHYRAAGAGIWKGLIIPVTAYDYAVRNTDPNAPHKDRHRKEGRSILYNPLKLDFSTLDRAVFVTEGELDALSIIQSGGAAVAVRSTNNTPALIERLRNTTPTAPRYIFGLFDSDEDGREADKQTENGLKDTFFLFKGYNLKKFGIHDPNDFLIQDPNALRNFIELINKQVREEYNK